MDFKSPIIVNEEKAEQLRDAIYRTSLEAFVQKTFSILNPDKIFKDNWHINCLCEHLTAVRNGLIRRLIINMPPRNLKSIITSIAFPAWLLGKNPHAKIIVASYDDTLAKEHSDNTRIVMQSDWYRGLFPNTILSEDQNEKDYFRTTGHGFRRAISIGARGVTGKGGGYLIIDDPQTPGQMDSEAEKIKAYKWFREVFITRQDDKKVDKIIINMQRLHPEDLTGALLEASAQQWHHICLPAETADKEITIQLQDKYWKMEKHSILHAEREGREELQELRDSMGERAYAAQYLQQPFPLGGAFFKDEWIQYYDYHRGFSAKECNIYILVDGANSLRDSADYTAIVVVGLSPDHNYYMLDLVRDKLDLGQRIQKVMEVHKKWTKLGGKPPAVAYERYGYNSDVDQLRKEQAAINHRFHITELHEPISKRSRIERLVVPMQQKRLYFPENCMQIDFKGKTHDLVDYIIKKELLPFPSCAHDDLLDALSQICSPALNAQFPRLNIKPIINIHAMIDNTQPTAQHWLDY